MAEVNVFLAHYGVPGMKWGKRGGSPSAAGNKIRDRRAAVVAKGTAQIQKAGSPGKAAAHVAKRTVGNAVLIKVGAKTLQSVASATNMHPVVSTIIGSVEKGALGANTMAALKDLNAIDKANK